MYISDPLKKILYPSLNLSKKLGLIVQIFALGCYFPGVVYSYEENEVNGIKSDDLQGANDAKSKIYNSSQEGIELGKSLVSEFSDQAIFAGRDITYRNISTSTAESAGTNVAKKLPQDFYSEYELRSLDSDESLVKASAQGAKILYEDLQSNSPSLTGQSYEIMLNTRKNRPINDLREDKGLRSLTEKVYEDLESKNLLLGDCHEELREVEEAGKIHVSDYKTCNRLVNRSSDCEIEHTVGAEPVIGLMQSGNVNYDNTLNIIPCEDDENCFMLFLGQKYQDNGGDCLKYLDDLKIVVYNPSAITKVAVSRLGWDDFFGAWITGTDNVIHPLVLPTKELPVRINSVLETTNIEAQARVLKDGYAIVDLLDHDAPLNNISCENTWHGGKSGENCSGGGRCNNLWDVHFEKTWDDYSLTRIFKTVEPNDTISIKTITSTTDDGMYLLHLKVYYNPTKVKYLESYTPQSCIDAAISLDEGMARGEYACLENIQNLKNDEKSELYTYSNGQKIYLDHFNAPLKNVSVDCGKIRVVAQSDYAVAPDEDASDIDYDQCSFYEKNCGFISSKCIEDGDFGNCYAYEEIYDCGQELEHSEKILKNVVSCDGEVRCAGNECIEDIYEASDSFGKVSGLLEAAQLMAQDMSCTGLDENGVPTGKEDVVCQVFSGQLKSCTQAMKGLGGLEVDCCEESSGISLASYICSLRALSRIDGAIASMDHASYLYGAYSEMRRPLFNAVSELKNQLSTITKPFVSWFENTTGLQGIFSSDKGITEYVTDKLKEKAKVLLKNILGSAKDNLAKEGIAEGAAGGGASDYASTQSAEAMIETMSSALAVVGYVYMVYQISSMVSQMIFKCTDESLELSAQRALKNCTYVGQYCSKKVLKHCVQKSYSYCCFSSPLSRILQEQIKKTQGIPFSTQDPKNPKCEGILTSELETIDWSKIDLTEWLDLLKISGAYAPDQELNIDNITGVGSDLSVDYSDSEISDEKRANVIERTLSRVMDLDMTKIRNDANKNVLLNNHK